MKRHMTTSLLLVFIAAASIVPLSACGNKELTTQGTGTQTGSTAGNVSDNASGNAAGNVQAGNAGTGTDEASAGGAATDPVKAEPEKKTEQISVFYTDDQMMDLHEEKADIAYTDETDKLKAAFAALQKDSSKGEASLWKHAELLSAKQDGAAVTLDVHLPEEARLGAPGEDLALQAITKTYFQFQDVESLDLLIDGKSEESLMGHDELDHPIKKQ
ncbi:GerMN domain-containing protein [Paenibacillus sp. R14(2021)]|uniref:GerMN domain-containing protein n=1 Tax=Paenibacillus sp. R14(2021) TaxID=2859228 RepID=UPI001C6147EA|nr:GerMN domain-containing protein [Paenibacillus sp. R14(2021)]